MRILLMLICFFITFDDVYSQVLNRIRDRAVRQVERRIEDKIVEAVSDEIARRMYKPIDKAIDDMLRASYQDSLGGEEVDWENVSEAYMAFLTGLNEAADLPDSYTFDLSTEVEIQDYDGSKNNTVLYFSKDKGIVGFEGQEDNKNNNLVIIDTERDIMVMYSTDSKGNKTAQAIPSMMKMTAALAAAHVEEEADNDLDFKMNKTSKTKRVAGYRTVQYTGESEDETIEAWVAEDFPVSWEKSFGNFLEQFGSNAYAENSAMIKGMVLQSENTRKDNPSMKTRWNTKKVNEKPTTIVNADYEFRSFVYEED